MEFTKAKLLQENASIVLLGNFDPLIITPRWLGRNGLIRESEADEAAEDIDVLHPEICIFKTSWFKIQVTEDKFFVETKDPAELDSIRDLFVGVISILEDTVVTAVGFNQHFQIKMETENDWHAIGDYYTPKKTWKKMFVKPGMLQVKIGGKRTDESGYVTIAVNPTSNTQYGITIGYNEHYGLRNISSESPAKQLRQRESDAKPKDSDAENSETIAEVIRICGKEWPKFMDYCRKSTLSIIEDPL